MIFIGMNHPKHFWMFRNIIEYCVENKIDYKVFVSDKDVLSELLNSDEISFVMLGSNKKGLVRKSIQMVWYTLIMIYQNIKFKPKILLGQALPHFAFSSLFFRKSKFYILEDTEHVSTLHKLTVPFCTEIFTTEKFPIKFGAKQVSLKTYYELLYLHPSGFKPDKSVVDSLNLANESKYAIIRLVSWNAHHDKDESGIDRTFLTELIYLIEKTGMKVYITSEIELSSEFRKYQLQINPIDIHSILYYSSMYVGEGATLAAEASILGVPSIYINSLNTNFCKELAERYNLMFNFRNTEGVLDVIKEILNMDNFLEQGQKINVLLNDKIDPLPYFIKLLQE